MVLAQMTVKLAQFVSMADQSMLALLELSKEVHPVQEMTSRTPRPVLSVIMVVRPMLVEPVNIKMARLVPAVILQTRRVVKIVEPELLHTIAL